MSPGGLLDTKEALRCFVHVASKEHLCVRVRTLAVYGEINKMVGEIKVWVGGILRGIPYTMVVIYCCHGDVPATVASPQLP